MLFQLFLASHPEQVISLSYKKWQRKRLSLCHTFKNTLQPQGISGSIIASIKPFKLLFLTYITSCCFAELYVPHAKLWLCAWGWVCFSRDTAGWCIIEMLWRSCSSELVHHWQSKRFSVSLMLQRLAKAQRASKRLVGCLGQDGRALQVLRSVALVACPYVSSVHQVRATSRSHHLLPCLSECQVRLLSCPSPPCRPPVGYVRTLWLVASRSEWHAPYRASPTLAVITLYSRSIVIVAFFVNVRKVFFSACLIQAVCLPLCLFLTVFHDGLSCHDDSLRLSCSDCCHHVTWLSSSSLLLLTQCGVAVRQSALPFVLALSFASRLAVSNDTQCISSRNCLVANIYVQI